MKLVRLAIVVAIASAAAACGGSSSSSPGVAKVGSTPITKSQLLAVLATDRNAYRKEHLPFPQAGGAEYTLLRQQTIDFLVQQTLAHVADKQLGIKAEDRVVTDASFVKVTRNIRIGDAEIQAYFQSHHKQYRQGSSRPLDRGTAAEIRDELLRKRRAAAMHQFVADLERRNPVTYSPGYAPVSVTALAKRIWAVPFGSPPCPLVEQPGGVNGFTGAEERDGFAAYLTSNAGVCTPDPRTQPVQVQPQPNTTPVTVSYLPRSGSATYRDKLLGFTLRYPRRLHIGQFEHGGVVSVAGVEIANFDLPAATAGRPLSPAAIDFSVTQAGGGPIVTRASAHDSKFPLSISDFTAVSGASQLFFGADGQSFVATIREGSAPSKHDLAALRAIVASIRFPPLRVGTFAPNGSYVLGRVSSYPLGSVTQIAAGIPLPYSRPEHVQPSGRFYLVHTADGFWTITWPDNLLHGYKACGPHFDPTSRRFTCPSGAVWDVKGNVVTNPNPAQHQDDPLDRSPADVSGGDVLVSLPPAP